MWTSKEGFMHWRFFFKFFTIELRLGRFRFNLAIDADGVSFVVPLVALYVHGKRERADKELSIWIHDWAIWWNLWTPTTSWSSETPRWRHGCWRFLDTLLGRAKYSREVIDDRIVQVPMPEGCYGAHILLCKDTWKRPRWFARAITRIDADIPDGIPHSGKGENSWDCGEDGCYGMCCPAKSIAEGVGIIVGSVLHDRVRYGGWREWNYRMSKENEIRGSQMA